MPQTITAIWPDLVSGKKAKASEVEAKFDWLEYNCYPMVGGEVTTGVYDLGSSAYKWRVGYFDNVVINGETLSSAQGFGSPLSAFAHVEITSSTISVQSLYNVSSVVRNATGIYTVTWDTAFTDNTYSVVGATSEGQSAASILLVYTQTAADVTIYTKDISNNLFDGRFSIIAAGGD